MTEHEMWLIVARVLGTTMKKVVLPVSLGLGLTLSAGCGDRAVGSNGDSGIESAEAAMFYPSYAGPMPTDTGILDPDGSSAHARYAAPFMEDAGVIPPPQADYMGSFPEPDFGMAPLYAASYPEPDVGPAAKYAGSFPKKDVG